MASSDSSLAGLSDNQLLAEVRRLVANERRATAALIRSLMELDARRLYLREGCSSLFTYCTQVLHLAEGAAYNRIEAARAARRFPLILDAIEDGALTLTAGRLLARHLTAANHRDVLASARHKSKREVELLISKMNPRPSTPPMIRKLPVRHQNTVDAASTVTSHTVGSATAEPPVADFRAPSDNTHFGSVGKSGAAVTPLAPERYKVQLTISRETHNMLRRVQDLLRHKLPNGDLAVIFDRALTLLLAELERRRCAATPSPRVSGPGTMGSRHIPAGVKREVWTRDAGQCAFVGTNGRCRETGFLEFHHVEPYAEGGRATVDNIQLRCRSHNLYEALLVFGQEPELVREGRFVLDLAGGGPSNRRTGTPGLTHG
jgi:HNH endonuclease